MKHQSFIPFWKQECVSKYQDNMNIVLLAHVQGPRGHINHAQLQCSETERFSIEEFNEIYQGIVAAGYYIQAVYFNEMDFIEDYIAHPNRFKDSLLYNLARNGLGDNRKTVIPAFCDLVGLKYSTSASLSCALCRNKYYFSSLLQSHNLPVPRSWLLLDSGDWIGGQPEDGTLVICKPCSESASQGVSEAGIFHASGKVFRGMKGSSYIVQDFIDGEECEVPVFKVGDTIMALPPVGIHLGQRRILDEQASSQNQYGFYWLHDTQTDTTINMVQEYAAGAFKLLNMDVYGRIDFRIDARGNPFIFDVSTTPYTTRHSSFAFAFAQLGHSYSDIYQGVIFAALQRTLDQNDKN